MKLLTIPTYTPRWVPAFSASLSAPIDGSSVLPFGFLPCRNSMQLNFSPHAQIRSVDEVHTEEMQ